MCVSPWLVAKHFFTMWTTPQKFDLYVGIRVPKPEFTFPSLPTIFSVPQSKVIKTLKRQSTPHKIDVKHLYRAFVIVDPNFNDPIRKFLAFPNGEIPIYEDWETVPSRHFPEKSCWRVKEDYLERLLQLERAVRSFILAMPKAGLWGPMYYGLLHVWEAGVSGWTKYHESSDTKAKACGRLLHARDLFELVFADLAYRLAYACFHLDGPKETRTDWVHKMFTSEEATKIVRRDFINLLASSEYTSFEVRRAGGWMDLRETGGNEWMMGKCLFHLNMPIYVRLGETGMKECHSFSKGTIFGGINNFIIPSIERWTELRVRPNRAPEADLRTVVKEPAVVNVVFNSPGIGQLVNEGPLAFRDRRLREMEKAKEAAKGGEKKDLWESRLKEWGTFKPPVGKNAPQYYEWSNKDGHPRRERLVFNNKSIRERYHDLDRMGEMFYDPVHHAVDIAFEFEDERENAKPAVIYKDWEDIQRHYEDEGGEQLETRIVDASNFERLKESAKDYPMDVDTTNHDRMDVDSKDAEESHSIQNAVDEEIPFWEVLNMNLGHLDGWSLYRRLQFTIGYDPKTSEKAEDSQAWDVIHKNLLYDFSLGSQCSTNSLVSLYNLFCGKKFDPRAPFWDITDLDPRHPSYIGKVASMVTVEVAFVKEGDPAWDVVLGGRWYIIREELGTLFNEEGYEVLVEGSAAALACKRAVNNPQGPKNAKQLVDFLARRGFAVATPLRLDLGDWELRELKSSNISANSSSPLGYKLKGEIGTKSDFQRWYLANKENFKKMRLRAAVMHGGLIWRLSIMFIGTAAATEGPSFKDDRSRRFDSSYKTLFNLKEGVYYDDSLTEYDVNLLCGVFKVWNRKYLAITCWLRLI